MSMIVSSLKKTTFASLDQRALCPLLLGYSGCNKPEKMTLIFLYWPFYTRTHKIKATEMKRQDILIKNVVFAPLQDYLNGAMELLVDLARVISDAEHSVGEKI